MVNENASIAKKEGFIGLLHGHFQIGQTEFDFGLYRVELLVSFPRICIER